MRLIAALSSELAVARRKARDLALKGAESRLATLLLDLARTSPDGARAHIRYTRRELGEMIGVSTETVIRLLTKLRQKNVIRMERRELVIADLERLKQVATHDDIAA
jgi:CRP-like cAMP-binding protein